MRAAITKLHGRWIQTKRYCRTPKAKNSRQEQDAGVPDVADQLAAIGELGERHALRQIGTGLTEMGYPFGDSPEFNKRIGAWTLFLLRVKCHVKNPLVAIRRGCSAIIFAVERSFVRHGADDGGRPRAMQAQQNSPLPEYTNPPVNEVVISAEILPLSKWQGLHAGVYWGSIRDRYPYSEGRPPLISPPEIGGDLFAQVPAMIGFMQPDSNRTWFISEDRTNIIQVQKDRFIVNWRQVVGDETYPRFESVMLPLSHPLIFHTTEKV